MILADTSVWIDHFRRHHGPLASELMAANVVVHEFVQGELLCGGIAPGSERWRLLAALPRAPLASHEEVVRWFTSRRLARSGVGWIDAHLLASALLGSHRILTLDGPLARVAARLGCAA